MPMCWTVRSGCSMTAEIAECDDCGKLGEVRHQWNFELGEVRTVCEDCGDGEPYSAPVVIDCSAELDELEEMEEENE